MTERETAETADGPTTSTGDSDRPTPARVQS